MLDQLRAIGGPSQELTRLEAQLKLARRHDLNALLDAQLTILEHDSSYANLILTAGILADLGRFDEADTLYLRASETYRDTSPLPLAFLMFQRGVMWGEKAGDTEKARVLYEEALHYLPQYAVANIHLAEILASNGAMDRAIQNLRTLAPMSDPEGRGVLGEMLAQHNSTEAGPLIDSAAAEYSTLLEKYPLAFADHAAEFFAGPGGDAARSYSLATLNLNNRRTERAYQVAIEAAAAAQQPKDVCRLVNEVQAMQPVSVPLKSSMAAHSAECAT